MAKKPSRDMLTTGLVGSYLLAAAWGIMLLGTMVVIIDGVSSFTMSAGAAFAGFGIVAGLLWLGGAVCEGVGWLGLARLYPGLPYWVGWLEASLPALSLLLVVVAVATLDLGEGLVHLMAVLQILHFLSAGIWMMTHGPRGSTMPAAIGYGLALIGGGTLYALLLAGINVETAALVLVLACLSGGTIAHLATGLLFARSRVLADSINTF